jgi:hypothetical protein
MWCGELRGHDTRSERVFAVRPRKQKSSNPGGCVATVGRKRKERLVQGQLSGQNRELLGE